MKKFIILLTILMLCGCEVIGPKYLPTNRLDYNNALLTSDNEQLLLNIVRMRYGQNPLFLGISNLTSQIDLSTSLGLPFSYSNSYSNTKTVSFNNNFNTNFNYSQRPTVSYSPLQGSQYTLQLLRPLEINQVYLFIRSGWSIARILRMTTQNIGELENAISASRAISSYAPQYKNFIDFSYYINTLERQKNIKIQLAHYKNREAIVFNFKTEEIGKEISSFLNLDKAYKKIILVNEVFDNDPSNVISIQTRSVAGVLYYLSKSLHIEQDTESMKLGVFPVTQDSLGNIFDWTNITKGLMDIHISKTRPKGNAISVYYRDKWFYIDDGDEDSKQTLVILGFLFSIKAGDFKTISPLLTISAD